MRKNSVWDKALSGASDFVANIARNTSVRDWVYIVAFVCAVYLCYITITGIKISFEKFWEVLYNNPPLWARGLLGIATPSPPPENAGTAPVLDTTALVQSVIIAYLLMKIDITDIASGVAALTTKIGALKA